MKALAFFDSGANISIVSYEFYCKLSKMDLINSKIKTTQIQASSVTGEILDILGKVSLYLIIGKVRIVHEVYVLDKTQFTGEILIGRDIMRRLGKVTFDLEENYIQINKHIMPIVGVDGHNLECFKVQKEDLSQNKLKVDKKIVLPPRSFVKTHGVVGKKWRGKTVVIESNCKGGLRVGNTLACVNEKLQIPFTIANYLDHEAVISKNELIGDVFLAEDEEIEVENIVKSENTFNLEDVDLDNLETKQQVKIIELIKKYKDAFAQTSDDIGLCTLAKHKINTGETKPIFTPQYRLPQATKEIMQEHIDKMLKIGLIERSDSAWNSPILLIKKSDQSFRFIFDGRQLNKVTEVEVMSMPKVSEILASLNGSRYFSVLDNLKGFNQILIEEKDRPKTSFIGPDNLKYEHVRMSFGLAGAPSTFTKVLNILFSEVLGKFCQIYMDDLILYSSSFEEHLKYLEQVLKIYKDAGLKLTLKKCKFAKESVKYLGHIISRKGIQIDPIKVQGIRDYQVPKNAKGVRRFLGMASYYRKFIKDFSKICAPLTNLTKKYSKFVWSDLENEAFNKIKELLSTSPILIHPDFNVPFKLHTDVSDLAIGAFLTQEIDGIDRPVAYFSRKLTPQETRYSVTEREALAIVKSVKHFDYYLYEHKFTIISDHQPLRYLFKFKPETPRIARWALLLTEYNFDVQFRAGKNNVIPDALSRSIQVINNSEEINPSLVLSAENVRKEQLRDIEWRRIINYFEGRNFERVPRDVNLSSFTMKEGCLHFISENKHQRPYLETLVIPHTLKHAAMYISHNSNLNFHSGYTKTLYRAEEFFYWPSMRQDLKEYCRSCLVCQKISPYNTIKAPLQTYNTPIAPGVHLGIDIVGPLPETEKGNKYIFSVIDHFSRFLQTYPIPNIRKETIVECLIDYINKFSIPLHVTVDNGTQFHSQLFKEVCDLFKTKIHYTTSFHPQSNSYIERSHRSIKKALISALEHSSLNQWEDYLSYVTLALNTSYHSSINEIPFFLFFGRDAILPLSDIIKTGASYDYIGGNVKEEMSNKIKKAYEKAHEFSTKTQSKRKEYYRDRNFREMEVGDFVWLKDNYRCKRGSKLKPRFLGPYRIIEKYSPVNYIIKPLYDQHKRTEKVHINRLKICKLPEWTYDFQEETENTPNVERNDIANEENPDSESDDDTDYFTVRRGNNNVNDSNRNTHQENRYNLRSRGPVIDSSNLPRRPIEYRSRNVIGLILILLIIKMFGCF